MSEINEFSFLCPELVGRWRSSTTHCQFVAAHGDGDSISCHLRNSDEGGECSEAVT